MPIPEPTPPNWQPVTEPLAVYRYVTCETVDDPDFEACFETDAERDPEKKPGKGEHPDHLHGLSAYDSLDAARDFWNGLRGRLVAREGEQVEMKLGYHIAELLLMPDEGFEYDQPENPEPQGHLWIKGPKDKLMAAAVEPFYAAARSTT